MSVVANRRSVMSCFSSPTDPECHRARIVLAEKDITVEIHDVDTNNLPEDLLDLNPYATVPTMVDRDLVLYNARVLIEYLDERFPHPPLMPVDPVSRAKSRLALFRIETIRRVQSAGLQYCAYPVASAFLRDRATQVSQTDYQLHEAGIFATIFSGQSF